MQMVASKYFEEGTLERCAGDASQVIPLLQVVQEKTGYVPEDVIAEISDITAPRRATSSASSRSTSSSGSSRPADT